MVTMRQGTAARIAYAVGAAYFLYSAADAAQPSLREVERRRAQAETSRKQLETDVRQAASRVDDLRRSLVMAGSQQQLADAEVARLEAAVVDIAGREAQVQSRSQHAQAQLEAALIALYRLEAAGEPAPDGAIAAAIGRASLAELQSITVEKSRVTEERVALSDAQRDLLQARRELAAREQQLSNLLAQESARETSLNRGLAAALAQEQRLAEQARSLRDLVRRSARRQATVQRASSSAKSASAGALPKALARLAPVGSVQLRGFGERTGAAGGAKVSKGVTLRLQPGAEIRAPANGTIGYAGPFRSYGLVLILNLDRDYAVVLTGADSALAHMGQEVLAGQPIAMMAQSASGDVTRLPELYVEVRRNGNPVDPSALVSAGQGRIAP